MVTVDLTPQLIERFLQDVGDTERRFFTEPGRVADAFLLAGGDYHAAVARGLYWLYTHAVNQPADLAGVDPEQAVALAKQRREAYEAWLKLPPTVAGVDPRGVTPPATVLAIPSLFGVASVTRRED